jgi:hypothetical protein
LDFPIAGCQSGIVTFPVLYIRIAVLRFGFSPSRVANPVPG